MECPICRLINPDSATRCDCGYDFKDQKIKNSYLYNIPNNTEKEIFTGLGNKLSSIIPILILIIIGITALITIIQGNQIIFSEIHWYFLLFFAFYFISPISIIPGKENFKVYLLFRLNLKFEWKDVSTFEMSLFGDKRLFILAKYMIFIIYNYGMKDYDELKNRISYFKDK